MHTFSASSSFPNGLDTPEPGPRHARTPKRKHTFVIRPSGQREPADPHVNLARSNTRTCTSSRKHTSVRVPKSARARATEPVFDERALCVTSFRRSLNTLPFLHTWESLCCKSYMYTYRARRGRAREQFVTLNGIPYCLPDRSLNSNEAEELRT